MGLFDGVKRAIRSVGSGVKKFGEGGITLDPSKMFEGGMEVATLGIDDLNPFNNGSSPGAPKPNKDLSRLRQAQLNYAKDFRTKLPGLKEKMSRDLTQESSRGLQESLRGLRSSDSARGLLFGGLHQGNEGKQRQQAQRGLMSGISGINTGLDAAANQMDIAATKTGIDLQAQTQALQNLVYQNAMAQQAGQNEIVGAGLSAAAIAAMLSDERAKENIRTCDHEIKEMLSDLKAVSYFYKNMVDGSQHFGIVAQDLEKSAAGKSVVYEHEGYKVIDTIKATGLVLASLANLHDRLTKLEGRHGDS